MTAEICRANRQGRIENITDRRRNARFAANRLEEVEGQLVLAITLAGLAATAGPVLGWTLFLASGVGAGIAGHAILKAMGLL